MALEFGNDATSKLALARAVSEHQFYSEKSTLTPTLSIHDWESEVRDLCAMYAFRVCLAEAQEAVNGNYSHGEVQAFLERRPEEVVREVMGSAKWPVEGFHPDDPLGATVREVNVRRHVDFIQTSMEWESLRRKFISRIPLAELRKNDAGQQVATASPSEPAPPQPDGKARKRGPKSDPEAAFRVAEIVARVAPDGDWRPKLDDICEALDEAQIPFPLRWRKRDRSCNG